MSKLRKPLVAVGILLFVVVGILATRGPAAASTSPTGTFSFAVLGDAPYYLWEEMQFRVVLQDLAAHDLNWVLHVGDIFWRPCTDEMYRRQLDWFNALPHPVIYTPGDKAVLELEPAFSPSMRLLAE